MEILILVAGWGGYLYYVTVTPQEKLQNHMVVVLDGMIVFSLGWSALRML